MRGLKCVWGAALLCVAPAMAKDPAWVTTKVKAGEFMFSMPLKPAYDKVKVSRNGVDVNVQRWVATYGQSTYIAAYAEMPPDFQGAMRMELAKDWETSQIPPLLEKASQAMASKLNAGVDAKAFGQFRGMPCMTTITRKDGVTLRGTAMVCPERFYFLVTATPDGQENGPTVKKFLSSFKRISK